MQRSCPTTATAVKVVWREILKLSVHARLRHLHAFPAAQHVQGLHEALHVHVHHHHRGSTPLLMLKFSASIDSIGCPK